MINGVRASLREQAGCESLRFANALHLDRYRLDGLFDALQPRARFQGDKLVYGPSMAHPDAARQGEYHGQQEQEHADPCCIELLATKERVVRRGHSDRPRCELLLEPSELLAIEVSFESGSLPAVLCVGEGLKELLAVPVRRAILTLDELAELRVEVTHAQIQDQLRSTEAVKLAGQVALGDGLRGVGGG